MLLVFLCWLRLRASVWPRLADRVQVMLHLLQEQKRRQASGEPDALCRLPMRPDHGHKLLQDLKDPRTNLVSHAPSLAPATCPHAHVRVAPCSSSKAP